MSKKKVLRYCGSLIDEFIDQSRLADTAEDRSGIKHESRNRCVDDDEAKMDRHTQRFQSVKGREKGY